MKFITLKTIRSGVLNLVLSLGSLLITYLILELVFFRLFLPRLPLRFHGYLSEPIRIFAQTSKNGLIPNDYIAIVGDSYAQGMGDWLLTANDWENQEFAPHNILYKRTGKDVITFGQAGVGSLGGLVAKPINRFRFLNSTIFYKIDEPKIILVYFYDNDINDNLKEIQMRFKDRYDMKKIYEKSYFREFISEVVIGEDALYKSIKSFRWYENLFFLKFIRNMVNGIIHKKKTNYSVSPWKAGEINHAFIKGKKISIPDKLQSPALELTEEEINLSVYIFERSLDYLSGSFPCTKIFVVYIPSPLASYDLASQKVSIQTYHGRGEIYPAKDVAYKSDLISKKIKKTTEEKHCVFIDPRESIRDASRKGLIHGPFDWKHLNKTGYTVLSEVIIPYILKEH